MDCSGRAAPSWPGKTVHNCLAGRTSVTAFVTEMTDEDDSVAGFYRGLHVPAC
jgi:hypothetical protein